MSDQHDGGPAFPVSPDEARGKVSSVHGGLTIRDYFAAAAMQGLLSNSAMVDTGDNYTWIAKHAYAQADAMLKERNG